MSTHASALPVGYKLDEYLIGRLLGHGGFGLTYLAQDTNLNALVAIKEFLPQEFAVRAPNAEVIAKSEFDAESYKWGLERFKEEARALARFKHPNIVRVSRLLESNGTAYMVMDFEPGMTLSQYLKRYGATLDEDLVLGMFLPVLDGLEALHRLQLVHRDIKPSNIYVRAYGGPMLIDFGAVRQAIGAQSRNLTSLVTPGYAPIEQYSSDGRQGAWSDLYAVGASIYYCMFGHAPADAARRSAALSDAGDDPYAVAITRGHERYSKELLECVDWALQFRVRDRPQTAHEVREKLRQSPVRPRTIELPESLNEVPELQYGVMSAPTQPAATNRPQPTALLSGGASLPGYTHGGPRTDVMLDDATVVSIPTAHGPDSLNPFIEGTSRGDATQVLRAPMGQRMQVQWRRILTSAKALWVAARGPAVQPQPNTQGPNTQNPSTLTSRLTQHLREPRSVRILITAVVVLALTATILTFSHRTGSDKQLYQAAVAANTVAAYQHYLDACRGCAQRADAQTAIAHLQKLARAADLQARFKDLLDHGQLRAPANPNAGTALHDLEAAVPDDAHIADDRKSLDDALKAEQQKAEEAKAAREAEARRQAKAAAHKPAKTASASKPSTAVASSGEQMPKAVFAPPPKYPSDAKGVSGWVDLEFNVNVDGSTSSAEVVDANPKGVFDDAALHAIHGWIFSPYTLNGVRERKRIRMRLQFKP